MNQLTASISPTGVTPCKVHPLQNGDRLTVAGDLAKALATTQSGIASPEHADFVSLLQKRAAQRP